MIIENYIRATSLEEAYQVLCKRPDNFVIGGCIGLNSNKSHLHTAIDISGLSLNSIQTDRDGTQIGAMATFHRLETDKTLPDKLREAFYKANYYAGGLQLKNHITVGGAVVSKYGRSNFLTTLLALDAKLVFYHEGEMGLADFLNGKSEKDILLYVKIAAGISKIVTDAIMYSRKDYPVLNVAAVKREDALYLSLGARPSYPVRLYELEQALAKETKTKDREVQIAAYLAGRNLFGSNTCAGAEYRKEVAVPLLSRVMEAYYEG